MAVPADKREEELWTMAESMAAASPDGMMILKEAFNTHAEIMNRSAVFAYHRQLNALGRVGRTRGDTALNLDESRRRTKKEQQ